MPSGKPPRRPFTAGVSRMKGREEPLSAYKEPLIKRRKSSNNNNNNNNFHNNNNNNTPTSTSSNHPSNNDNNNKPALSQLSDEERSICNLMIDILQYKSSEESRRIISEIEKAAQSCRLLAQYTGVYANNTIINKREKSYESGKAQLIRYLQHQQKERQREKEIEKEQENEEKRKNNNNNNNNRMQELNGKNEKEKSRERWQKLFGRDKVNRNEVSSYQREVKRKNSTQRRKSTPSGKKEVQQNQHNKQKQEEGIQKYQNEKEKYEKNKYADYQKFQKYQEEEEEEEEEEIHQQQNNHKTSKDTIDIKTTALPTTNNNNNNNNNIVSSVPPNIPRRVKPQRCIASFDEHCADRYRGEAEISNDSLPSNSIVKYNYTSIADDSVRQSTSFPSQIASHSGGGISNINNNNNNKEKEKLSTVIITATMKTEEFEIDEEVNSSLGVGTDFDEAPPALIATVCPTSDKSEENNNNSNNKRRNTLIMPNLPVPPLPRLSDNSNNNNNNNNGIINGMPDNIATKDKFGNMNISQSQSSTTLSSRSSKDLSEVEEEFDNEYNQDTEDIIEEEDNLPERGRRETIPGISNKFPYTLDDDKLPWEI